MPPTSPTELNQQIYRECQDFLRGPGPSSSDEERMRQAENEHLAREVEIVAAPWNPLVEPSSESEPTATQWAITLTTEGPRVTPWATAAEDTLRRLAETATRIEAVPIPTSARRGRGGNHSQGRGSGPAPAQQRQREPQLPMPMDYTLSLDEYLMVAHRSVILPLVQQTQDLRMAERITQAFSLAAIRCSLIDSLDATQIELDRSFNGFNSEQFRQQLFNVLVETDTLPPFKSRRVKQPYPSFEHVWAIPALPHMVTTSTTPLATPQTAMPAPSHRRPHRQSVHFNSVDETIPCGTCASPNHGVLHCPHCICFVCNLQSPQHTPRTMPPGTQQ